MVFKKNFVAVVKVGGKIMREDNGEVKIPFGSEYTILLKSKDTRKAVVSIEIDGQDVLDRKQLIVYPNSDSELQGFMDGQTVKNRFKFIQKTKEIADYRGDRIDDGIVRIAFRFEKEVMSQPIFNYYPINVPYWDHHHHHHPHPYRWDWYIPYTYTAGMRNADNTPVYTADIGSTAGASCSAQSDVLTSNMMAGDMPHQDEGITVKGSQTYQNFVVGSARDLEDQEHVIILILKGYGESGAIVSKPVDVKTKSRCGICGKTCEFGIRFCSNCGTFLE